MLMQANSTTPSLWNRETDVSPLKVSNWIDEVFENALRRPSALNTTFTPEINVYETDNEFEVSVALPGMNKDDLEINYNSGVLTISGERKLQKEDKSIRYHRIESRFGRFRRTLPLPSDVVNADKIKAKYENGVLNVTIPKMEEKAAKKIKIM